MLARSRSEAARCCSVRRSQLTRRRASWRFEGSPLADAMGFKGLVTAFDFPVAVEGSRARRRTWVEQTVAERRRFSAATGVLGREKDESRGLTQRLRSHRTCQQRQAITAPSRVRGPCHRLFWGSYSQETTHQQAQVKASRQRSCSVQWDFPFPQGGRQQSAFVEERAGAAFPGACHARARALCRFRLLTARPYRQVFSHLLPARSPMFLARNPGYSGNKRVSYPA